MSVTSLQFKGLQHGKSLEAQSFPSQGVNNKNPQRERKKVLIPRKAKLAIAEIHNLNSAKYQREFIMSC